jgi:hypothetical protein
LRVAVDSSVRNLRAPVAAEARVVVHTTVADGHGSSEILDQAEAGRGIPVPTNNWNENDGLRPGRALF